MAAPYADSAFAIVHKRLRRQTKGAATDKLNLLLPRHISTLHTAAIDVLVARHLHLRNIVLHFDLDILFGIRHDARMKICFLQPRWTYGFTRYEYS